MAISSKELFHLERGIHRYRRTRHQQMMGRKGLRYGQPLMLMILYDEQPICQTKLASLMNVTPASVTVSLKRMEKSGWIVKETNPDDMRYSVIRLTPAGEELAEYSRNEMERINRQQYVGFSEEELSQLYRFYERMNQNLQQEATNQ